MKACGRGRLSTPLERGCVLNGRPRHRIPGSLLRFVENCSLSSFKKGKYFSSRASLFADRDILSPPLFILPYSPLPLPSAAGRFFNDGVAWCRNLLSSRRIGFLRRQVGDGPTLKHDSRLSSGFPPSRISLRIAQSFEIRNDKFATRFTQVCFSTVSKIWEWRVTSNRCSKNLFLEGDYYITQNYSYSLHRAINSRVIKLEREIIKRQPWNLGPHARFDFHRENSPLFDRGEPFNRRPSKQKHGRLIPYGAFKPCRIKGRRSKSFRLPSSDSPAKETR